MSHSRLILVGVLAAAIAAMVWWLQSDPATKNVAAATTTPTQPNHPGDSFVSSSPPSATKSATAAHAAAVSPALQAGEPRFARRQQWERSGYDAAGEGAESAWRALPGITGRADRQAFLRGMFARLGEGDTAGALQAFKQLANETDRDLALEMLVETWAPAPLAPDDRFPHELSTRGGLIMRLAGDPALAAEVARAAGHPSELPMLLGELARRDAKQNPERALSHGDTLQGAERTKFLTGFAYGWADADAAAAWAWSQQVPDVALRETLQEVMLRSMGRNDPKAAAENLAQIAQPESRKRALHLLGAQWGQKDTQLAFQWAQALPDPVEREVALGGISEAAPVGIGAVLATSPDGYPTIREVVPGSAASDQPQIAKGSRIAAIRDANGQSVDMQGKDLSEAVSLLRGAPGTSVTLEVIPSGGTPADRRIVVLTRRQLMFKQ